MSYAEATMAAWKHLGIVISLGTAALSCIAFAELAYGPGRIRGRTRRVALSMLLAVTASSVAAPLIFA